jgi:hypothetical protein
MRTSPRAGLAFSVACLVAASSLACKSAKQRAEEREIEQTTGGQVHVDPDKGVITVQGEGGTATVSLGPKVPDDFPKNVPVYPGAKVDLASKANGNNGKPGWSLTLETPDPPDKVASFYRANMTGFVLASDLDMGESKVLTWQSAAMDANVMATKTLDEKTSITLNVAGK